MSSSFGSCNSSSRGLTPKASKKLAREAAENPIVRRYNPKVIQNHGDIAKDNLLSE
jgi:hypothetical protein